MRNDFDDSLDETSMYDQGDREEITAVLEAADDVYISIDNVSYHVSLRGEGMPLICLHGFGEAGDTWDKLQLPGFRLYCVDFLGHGVSDRSHNPVLYQLDTVLRHLYTLIHTLVGEEPYGLMGYSMGGRIALQYAAMYEPSRLLFLILESASAGIEDINERQERAARDEVLAHKIETHSIEWFEDMWSKLPIFETQQKLSPAVQHTIKERRLSNTPEVLAHTLRGTGQGMTPYVGNKISELEMEILYVSGSLDTKYDTIGQTVFGNCENVAHVSVAEAGHNVHTEMPDAFNDIVNLFLSDYNDKNIS